MKRSARAMLCAISFILCFSLCSCGLVSKKDSGDDTTAPKDTEARITQPAAPDTDKEPPHRFNDGKTVVCIDPGHGFRDVGCDTAFLNGTESEVTLDIAMLMKNELEARGATVILLHDGKTFPSAKEITENADKKGIEYKPESIIDNDIFSAYERAIYASTIGEEMAIDLYISLHVNSIEGHPEVGRYEIDYYEGNPEAAFLADFCSILAGKLKGEKDAVVFRDDYENAFIVTKPMTHPSVLIEMGYATNEHDASDMNDPEWRAGFVNNVCDSLDDALKNAK